MNKKLIKNFGTGLQISTQSFIIPSVDTYVTQHPEWQSAWFLARGMLLTVFQLQQERLNIFIEELETNKEVFTSEEINTKEFQLGFVVTLENYLKTRQEDKLKIIKNIFLGYTEEGNKEKFELERYYSVVNQISLEGIEFLEFVKTDISDGEIKVDLSRELIGYFNKEINKSKHIITFKTVKERLSELLSLGIVRISGYATIADPNTFQDNVYYSFTEFGLKFITFLENKSTKL